MPREMSLTEGLASINAWDQSHAEALGKLRRCCAFALVSVDEDGQIDVHALSRDISASGMDIVLRAGAETLVEMADDLEAA